MPEHVTDNIEIFSNDSDREDSEEENSDEENFNEEYSHKGNFNVEK